MVFEASKLDKVIAMSFSYLQMNMNEEYKVSHTRTNVFKRRQVKLLMCLSVDKWNYLVTRIIKA